VEDITSKSPLCLHGLAFRGRGYLDYYTQGGRHQCHLSSIRFLTGTNDYRFCLEPLDNSAVSRPEFLIVTCIFLLLCAPTPKQRGVWLRNERWLQEKKQRCIKLQIILNRQYRKSSLRIEELPKNMQKIFFTTSTRWHQRKYQMVKGFVIPVLQQYTQPGDININIPP
jgi:hypothetical protein